MKHSSLHPGGPLEHWREGGGAGLQDTQVSRRAAGPAWPPRGTGAVRTTARGCPIPCAPHLGSTGTTVSTGYSSSSFSAAGPSPVTAQTLPSSPWRGSLWLRPAHCPLPTVPQPGLRLCVSLPPRPGGVPGSAVRPGFSTGSPSASSPCLCSGVHPHARVRTRPPALTHHVAGSPFPAGHPPKPNSLWGVV